MTLTFPQQIEGPVMELYLYELPSMEYLSVSMLMTLSRCLGGRSRWPWQFFSLHILPGLHENLFDQPNTTEIAQTQNRAAMLEHISPTESWPLLVDCRSWWRRSGAVPRISKSRVGENFSGQAPLPWNQVPVQVRDSISAFKVPKENLD